MQANLTHWSRWLPILLVAPWTQAAESRFLEEVIVTAEKVEKSVQETPIAITAFNEEFIEDTGISDIDDLSLFVPSFSRTQWDLAIRGISRNYRSIGGDVGVAVYQNGIYTEEAIVQGSELHYYDLQRVEVLRGPQGTLYGRNATGGVVNYVFNPPTHEFFAETMLRGGEHSTSEIFTVLNGSLIPQTLAARLVAVHASKGPDRDSRAVPGEVPVSDTGGSRDDAIVLTLDYTPSDNFDVSFRLSDRTLDSVPRAPLLIGEGTGDRRTRSSALCFPEGIDCFAEPTGEFLISPVLNPNVHQSLPISGNGFGEDLDNVAYPDVKPVLDLTTNGAYVDGNYHFGYGQYTLRYIGGYFEAFADLQLALGSPGGRNTCSGRTCEPGPGQLVSAEYGIVRRGLRQTTHELQFITNLDGPINFVTGIFKQDAEVESEAAAVNPAHLGTYTTNPSYGQILDPSCCTPNGPRHHDEAINSLNPVINLHGGSPRGEYYWWDTAFDTDAIAVFGQLNWQISETWSASLGVRWSRDEKTGSERRWFYLESGDIGGLSLTEFNQLITTDPITGEDNGDPLRFVGLPLEVLDGIEVEDSWENVSWHASATWTPSRKTRMYASLTTGYRSGGFSLGYHQPGGYDEETVLSYEIGAKTLLFSDRLRANASVYYYDYKDHQVQANLDVPLTIYDCEGDDCPTVNDTFTLFSAVGNVPGAVNWGTEVELLWSPTDSLVLGALHSYIHTEIVDDYFVSLNFNDFSAITSTEVVNTKGNQLNRAPRNKFTLFANFTFPLGDRGKIDLLATYAYTGEQNNYILNDAIDKSPPFERWDARLTWDSATGRYRVAAFVKNITNELGIVEMRTARNFGRQVDTTAPRTWGLEFRMRFGNWTQSEVHTVDSPRAE